MASERYDFVISRSHDHDECGIWRLDVGAEQLLTEVTVKASLHRTHQIASMGRYILEWGPVAMPDYYPSYPYRLLEFDPASDDPLGTIVLQGAWPKSKFWIPLPDFGNPGGAKKVFQETSELILLPLPNFVLNLIPLPGRTTFQLFSFDPAPPLPSGDPLPYAQLPQASFEALTPDDVLLALGNFVLDWRPTTNRYRVWSFDPQSKFPLARPTVQSGTWRDIDQSHRLVAIGDHVLDWIPGDGSYRLWAFDPKQGDPLVGPVRTGTLPSPLAAGTTSLTGIQPLIPVDPERAKSPATIDFARTKIKHVVYYMLENRSFDHVLGWLYEHQPDNVSFVGSDQPFKGASTSYSNVDPGTGNTVHVSKYNRGQLSDKFNLEVLPVDPYHDNADVLRQLFNDTGDGYEQRATPTMAGFVWNNGLHEVMETYTPEQLPVLNGLARAFAVSDEWFCSHPGATDANRAFGLTGSSLGQLNNFMNGNEYQFWPDAPHRPSIFKVLWSNGITDWKIYSSVEWMSFVLTYHLYLQGQIPQVDSDVSQYVATIDQFKADAQAGTLPAFSYVEPVWIGTSGTSSYHPGPDLVPGERCLNDLYNALRTGPCWQETMLVITFDEHGGIYDHVPPPYAENPWPNDAIDGFRFDLMGPRVPTIVVSPWVRPSTVFRSGGPVPFDATSILATILEWCGVPRARWGLGERARLAPTFESVFQATDCRTDAPVLTPPYDVLFPASGGVSGPLPVHDLHRLLVPRAVWALSGGRRTPAEAQALAEEILASATDLATLARLVDASRLT